MCWLMLAALTLFVSHTAAKALYSPWLIDAFSEALAIKAELMPAVFPLHMLSGGQGLVWLVLLASGIGHIRRGHSRAHRAAMLLAAATTSGAVFFLICLALFGMIGAHRHYHLFYACKAWIALALPVLVIAMWLKRTGASPFDHR